MRGAHSHLFLALLFAAAWSSPASARPISQAQLSSAEARINKALANDQQAVATEEAIALLSLLTDSANSFPGKESQERALRLVSDVLARGNRRNDAAQAAAALASLTGSEPTLPGDAMATVQPRADGFAELAAAAKAAPRDGDAAAAIAAYGRLGDYLQESSRLAEAADAYRERLALRIAKQPGEMRDRVDDIEALVWVLDQLGRNSEAIDLLRAAIPLAEQAWRGTGATETYNGSFDSMGAAMALANLQTMLGGSLSRAGADDESDQWFERGLALRQKYFSRPTPFVARSYNQMAFYRNFRGRFAEAETNARAALAIMDDFRSADSEPDITYAKYKYNLAAALLGQGRAREAVPLLRYGVPVQRGGFPPDHPDLAILLTTLSRAIVSTGDDPVEALALAREAAAIARGHRDARMAGGASRGGDAQAAALSRAVAGDPATNDPLGMAYGALLEAAVAASDRPRADRLALVSEAFVAAQDIEQSVAGQAMAAAAARRFGGDGPLGKLITAKQQLTEQAQARNAALAAALAEGDAARAEAERRGLANIASQLAATDAELLRDYPAVQRLIAPQSADGAAIQSRLSRDDALLFTVPSGANVYVFVVTSDDLRVFALKGAAAQVAASVRRLRCRVDEAACASEADYDQTDPADRAGTDAYFPRFDGVTAHQLYQQLLAPAETMLAGKKNVYVTASGALSGLPFSLLLTEAPPEGAAMNSAAALQKMRWLGTRHAFVTLPSVATLAVVRDARAMPAGVPGAPRFIGYGAPVLKGSDAVTRSVEAGGRRAFRSGVAGQVPTNSLDALRALSALPGTEVELARMADTLGAGVGALRTGAAATEAAVRADRALPAAAVITFATHGLLAGEIGSNAEPGLVFTPPSSASAVDDGLLTASEAAQLSLTADWLILSACNTASADGSANGQSLSGLARSFLHAGARALLVSHWRVSDDVTAALTVETVRLNRMEAVPKAAALQAAINAVRTGQRRDGTPLPGWKSHWAHPAAWAPFVVVADEAS
jgi:CHAT domain-containing protein